MKTNIYLILIIFLVSCTSNSSKKSIPILVLNEADNTNFIQLDFDEKKFKNAKFNPLYIGNYLPKISYDPISKYDYYRKLDSLSVSLDSDKIPEIDLEYIATEIFVDTSQKIKYFGLSPIPEPPNPIDSLNYSFDERLSELKNESIAIIGYPVFITNNSNKHIFLGQFNSVAFSIEIYQNGVWKEIEKPFLGDGYDKTLLLSEKSICITLMPIFSNLEGQKLRLKLRNIYSNEFE